MRASRSTNAYGDDVYRSPSGMEVFPDDEPPAVFAWLYYEPTDDDEDPADEGA